MPATQPNPRTWILRFKNNRSTVLLHIDPLQTLSSVKQEILKAVQQTNPSGTFNGHDIPNNSDEIELARPSNINDLSEGWEPLEPKESSEFADDTVSGSGKGKGKASTGSSKSKSSGKDCLQGAGLRDGGIVAFKFKSKKEDEEDWQKVEQDGDIIAAVEGDAAKNKWDVVVPTIEDTYGEEDAAAEMRARGDGV